MKTLLTSLLVLTGCGPVLHSVANTRCGMKIAEGASASLLVDAQFYEDQALQAFAEPSVQQYDPRFATACERVSGWFISEMPSESWEAASGNEVLGLTHCDTGVIEIGNTHRVHFVALAHEMAHAIQGCVPPPGPNIPDESHRGWEPLFNAITANTTWGGL